MEYEQEERSFMDRYMEEELYVVLARKEATRIIRRIDRLAVSAKIDKMLMKMHMQNLEHGS